MKNTMYAKLVEHIGHDIECVRYGRQNVSIECLTCNAILVSEDYEVEDHPKTYKVVRMYQERDKPSEIIKTGLTKAEAMAHCQRDDTKGDGWFDGFSEEEA